MSQIAPSVQQPQKLKNLSFPGGLAEEGCGTDGEKALSISSISYTRRCSRAGPLFFDLRSLKVQKNCNLLFGVLIERRSTLKGKDIRSAKLRQLGVEMEMRGSQVTLQMFFFYLNIGRHKLAVQGFIPRQKVVSASNCIKGH
jgi:hypothetical protein